MDKPRSTYVPLTKHAIDLIRACLDDGTYTKQEQKDIGVLCDMAINSLLYAQEIDRLRATRPEGGDIMHRLYQRLAPLAFMPTEVPKEEAKRLGYPHVRLGDVEEAIRAECDLALNALSPKAVPLHPHVDGRDFYELCQQYRNSKEIGSMPNTVEAFNNLRDYIKTGRLPWASYERQVER